MVITTTRDTHRLATCSEKELGTGHKCEFLFLTYFQQMPLGEWRLKGGEEGWRSSWPGLQVPWLLWGNCFIPLPPTPLVQHSPGIFLQLHPQPE